MSEPPATPDPPAPEPHHQIDDDLLAGFDRPGRRSSELRGFFASTLAASLFAWEIAFDFGAYHTVFYSRLLQLFVVSCVLLLGALALRRQIAVRPWMRVALGVPVIWFLFRLFAPARHGDNVYHAVDLTLVALTVATLPLTLWALARILAPEFFALSSRRLRVTAVLIVVVIAAVGVLVGQFNNAVLTCHEFVLAGDDTPANCRDPAPPTATP